MTAAASMNPRPSLKRRSFRAGVWAGGSHVLSQLIRLAGNLVLTRILMPEAFGLMAVIFTIMLALGLLSDIGSGTVLVQSKRGAEREFVDTAWTLQVIRGGVIWLASLAVAGTLAFGQHHDWFREGTVYDDARLPLLVAVCTFMMFIQGFQSLNGKLALRNLDLKRVSLIELAVQVLTLAFMVIAAWLTRSIWALALGGLFTAVLQVAFTHTLLPGAKPRLRLEPEAVKELIGKGKWVLVSSLLGFVALNGDRFLLGGLIDTHTMGLYSIAFGLAAIAPSALSAVLAKVIFPAFSEVVRDRPAQLATTYRKFQQITDAAVGCLAGFMFMASDAIIGVMYDARYLGAGPIFGMLAVGSIGARYLVVEQIYTAKGQTSLLAAAILPRAAVIVAGVPLGYAMAGLHGALVAIVLSQFAHWPMALWFRHREGLNQLRNDIVLPLALLLGGAAGWLAVQLLRLITH